MIPPDQTDNETMSRILASLRASGRRPVPAPRRIPGGRPLPRRIPGQNPGSYSPWPSRPPSPAVRDAAAMAANMTGYHRGWRRGQSARLVAAATTTAAPAPAYRHTIFRRLAIRPGAAATRLVGLVVRALPEWERPRYSEEFRAELRSLNGFRQLTYAICLMLSAPALRRALRQQGFTDVADTQQSTW